MKKFCALIVCTTALLACGCTESKNLVPQTPANSHDIWCTWRSQTRMAEAAKIARTKAQFAGDQGGAAFGARDNMNEEIIFGKNGKGGFVEHYDGIRGDMFFLFDDGWDVPFKSSNGDHIQRFGSIILDQDRFPSFKGSPQERLKKLNDTVVARGWKGAGLWIAAQKVGEKWSSDKTPALEQKEYWKERILWSKYAGIKYWKVDWGGHMLDIEFRKMLTDLGREHHPELLIEHSLPSSPLNSVFIDKKTGQLAGSGRLKDWPDATFLPLLDKIMPLIDCIRSYDVIGDLEAVTTFDRIAYYLQSAQKSSAKAILNGEDALYMSSAMGLSCGVMRTPLYPPVRNGKICDASKEVYRAIRWHRIAPAFPMNSVQVCVSDEILTDNQFFPKGSTWCKEADGRKVSQSAPASISRGTALPIVKTDGADKPFVGVTLNPNGALSVVAIARKSEELGLRTPLADITVDVDVSNRKVGLFGYFKSVTFNLSKPIDKVWAQDLASDTAKDVTKKVQIKDGKITIEGELLKELCPPDSQNDTSEPAIVLYLPTVQNQ